MVHFEEIATERISNKILKFFPGRNLLAILGRSISSIYRVWEMVIQIPFTADFCEFCDDSLTLLNYKTGKFDFYTISTGEKLCTFKIDLADGESISVAAWTSIVNYKSTNRLKLFAIGTDRGTIKIYLNGSLLVKSSKSPNNGVVKSIAMIPNTSKLASFVSTKEACFVYVLECSCITDNDVYLAKLSSQRQITEVLLTQLERSIQSVTLENKSYLEQVLRFNTLLELAFVEYEIKPGHLEWKRLTIVGDYDDDIFQTLKIYSSKLQSFLKVFNLCKLKFAEEFDAIIALLLDLNDAINCLMNSARIARLPSTGNWGDLLQLIIATNDTVLRSRKRFQRVLDGLISYIEFMLRGVEIGGISNHSKEIANLDVSKFFLYQDNVEFSLASDFKKLLNVCGTSFNINTVASEVDAHNSFKVEGVFVNSINS